MKSKAKFIFVITLMIHFLECTGGLEEERIKECQTSTAIVSIAISQQESIKGKEINSHVLNLIAYSLCIDMEKEAMKRNTPSL